MWTKWTRTNDAFRTHAVEPLGEAALGFKRLSLCSELAVEQAAGDRQQHQCCVGGKFGEVDGVDFVDDVDSFCPLGPLCPLLSTVMLFPYPLRHFIGSGAPAVDQSLPTRIVTLPDRQAALAQEIFVVKPQLFQAGPRHVGEFEFGLFRGARSLAPFGDVLHPRPRRLHHLVMGTAALVDVAVAKTDRYIIHQLRHLKALELSVATMLRDQRFVGGHTIRSLMQRTGSRKRSP